MDMSTRGQWALFAAVAVAFLVVAGFAIGPDMIHRQALGLGATDVHDAATLPDRLSICGRDWTRDSLDRRSSRSELLALYGVEPTLVDPLPFAPCPEGPCAVGLRRPPCDTVVFVRVGRDAYLSYELVGGP
jgi:hypothetical protein